MCNGGGSEKVELLVVAVVLVFEEDVFEVQSGTSLGGKLFMN